MSRRLTTQERTRLIEYLARELLWITTTWEHDGRRAHAAKIVDAMSRDAISAATVKRALDRTIDNGLTQIGATDG